MDNIVLAVIAMVNYIEKHNGRDGDPIWTVYYDTFSCNYRYKLGDDGTMCYITPLMNDEFAEKLVDDLNNRKVPGFPYDYFSSYNVSN